MPLKTAKYRPVAISLLPLRCDAMPRTAMGLQLPVSSLALACLDRPRESSSARERSVLPLLLRSARQCSAASIRRFNRHAGGNKRPDCSGNNWKRRAATEKLPLAPIVSGAYQPRDATSAMRRGGDFSSKAIKFCLLIYRWDWGVSSVNYKINF